MTRYILAALTACALLGLSGNANAQADTTSPTISFDSPANGVDLNDVTDVDVFSRGRVTITGTATDDTRVDRVQYRIEGSRRWRTAFRINDQFSFRVSVKRGKKRRIYVRALDDARNESDIIGRIVRRSR